MATGISKSSVTAYRKITPIKAGENVHDAFEMTELYGNVSKTSNLIDVKNLYFRDETSNGGSYVKGKYYYYRIDELDPNSQYGGVSGKQLKAIQNRGNYITTVIAEDGAFPANGPHTDGYWYVRKTAANSAPTIVISSPADAQTLYENEVFGIAGTVTDTNSGDVVSVKYSIDGGAAQAITAIVSTGSAASFAKNLTYKSGKLYDGATALTDTLAEGSQHSVKVWAEDDKGGKSAEITRTFYVVPNRAATLTLDAFVTRTGLINTDVVNIGGKVADLDNGNVIVKYKIGNGAFVQVFNGTVGATPTPFNFNVLLADLVDGENQITIQAVDAYNAITQQVLTIRKNKNEVPMLEAVTYYEITPPNGTSDGLQLYIEREVGDLVVAADVYMGAPGQSEVFVPMTLASTANLTNGNVEDTFSYEHGSDVTKIVVRIKMTRSSGASNKAIKKISGVLT